MIILKLLNWIRRELERPERMGVLRFRLERKLRPKKIDGAVREDISYMNL